MTVLLDWKVLFFISQQMPFTLSISTDTKHRITVNLVYGRSQSVSLHFGHFLITEF